MTIRLLSEKAINRIAAGEVVERPVSVVKELVENAIDAGATKIDIRFARGGRTLIAVSDNGCGIPKDELKLALQRHTTSKIKENNLDDINFFGFRGEALSSIAAVGLLTIISKKNTSDEAWKAESFNKNYDEIEVNMAKREVGTTIELRDIFCFSPNRIKFLKSETAENVACVDLVKRFIICFPNIKFKLFIDDKLVISAQDSDHTRNIKSLLGEDFIENTINFTHKQGKLLLKGYIGLPTFNHSTSLKQYYFVNNRIVKDKLMVTAVKIAYAGLIPNGKYPTLILAIECPNNYVDVNVHPTKLEVRFADEQLIKKNIIDAIRSNINANRGKQSNSIISTQFTKNNESVRQYIQPSVTLYSEISSKPNYFNDTLHSINYSTEDIISKTLNKGMLAQTSSIETTKDNQKFLGYAISQIDNTYIVSLTANNEVIIIDQHAAHERILLEEMKKQIIEHNIKIQHLLVPNILSYDRAIVELLIEKKDDLQKFGITIERNGINQIALTAVPSLIQDANFRDIIDHIIQDIQEIDEVNNLKIFIDSIYSNIACKNSIKANRKLSIEEMNSLLRKMEDTPFIEQCNHGRPTYIIINTKNLDKFFERN